MVIHAALHYDAHAVGITISKAQAALRGNVSRRRASPIVSRSGSRTIAILRGAQFDAISSVGMSEHVGHDKLDTYFETLRAALVPQGRS